MVQFRKIAPGEAFDNPIKVGQIYECTQSAHKNWRVEVVHVGTNHIQAKGVSAQSKRAKARSKNGNFNYLIAQFRRDFSLMQDVVTETFDKAPEPIDEIIALPESTKTCITCHESKPFDAFGTVPRSNPTRYFDMCMACRTAKRLATMKANGSTTRGRATPDGTPEVPFVQPAVPTPRPDIDAIAIQLMDLAKQVEQLGTPPDLITLAHAARDVVMDGEFVHGVYIVNQTSFDKLVEAFTTVKSRIQWETE